MDQNLAASVQQDLFIVLSTLLAVESGVIAGKTINSDAISKRSLTKNEIP
jgi:hypothetical protein